MALAANGVGIGSYVYLRRVFEAVINSTYDAHLGSDAWDEAEYQRSKMDERILSSVRISPYRSLSTGRCTRS